MRTCTDPWASNSARLEQIGVERIVAAATEPGRHILLRIGQVSRRPHAAGAWQLVLAGRSRPHSSRHPINAQCRRCGRLCYLSPKSENDLRKLGSFCQDRGNIHILFCIIDAASLAFRGAGLKRREGFGWPPRLKARVRSCAEVQPLVPVPNPNSCRSFLHDLRERMDRFRLARRGDQSTGNKSI